MNRLYRNLGDYRFEDVTTAVGLGETSADSFTAIFADFTGDDRPTSTRPATIGPTGSSRTATALQGRDDQGRADRARGQQHGRRRGRPDRLGWPRPVHHPDHRPGPAVRERLRQHADGGRPGGRGTTFTNDAEARGILDTAWGWGTAFVDADLDADLDLFAVQGMRAFVGDEGTLDDATSTLFLNDGTGMAFTVARGPAATSAATSERWWCSTTTATARRTSWSRRSPGRRCCWRTGSSGRTGSRSARTGADDGAIGARVTVTAGDRDDRQIILAGGRLPRRTAARALLRAGRRISADVTIEWADGTITRREGVTADTVLDVERP